MRYAVVWLAEAEEELAALWLGAHDRDAITRAAIEIERRLQSPNAASEGEARSSGRRIVFEAPLGVIFRVDDASRRVTISHVLHSGAR